MTLLGAPAAASCVGQQVGQLEASTAVKHFNWTLSAPDAVRLSFSYVSFNSWVSYGLWFGVILLVAAIRWGWHSTLRQVTNRLRRDGAAASKAPLIFFAIHTSGIAAWWLTWEMLWAINVAYYDENYAKALVYLEGHSYILIVPVCIFACLTVGLAVGFVKSNSAILIEIYRSRYIARWVRVGTWTAMLLIWPSVINEVVRWSLRYLASASAAS